MEIERLKSRSKVEILEDKVAELASVVAALAKTETRW